MNRDSFIVTNKKEKINNNSDKLKTAFEEYAKNPSHAKLIEISKKYKDDENFMEELGKYISKKTKHIRKNAKKLAEKIMKKYGNNVRPTHEILKKMLKFKEDYKLSDMEYDMFRRFLSEMIEGRYRGKHEIIHNNTRIGKTLGQKYQADAGINIKDADQGILAEILKMYNDNFFFHEQLTYNTIIYDDCSIVAMTGNYDRNKHIVSNYIHPILAAMFLPKIEIFELQMLQSNFGRMIKSRYDRTPIHDGDYLLYDDIITDPNDVVCEVNSAMGDLRNRYQFQIMLWKTVNQLRNGNYYESGNVNQLYSYLNTCRNNLYDNPDTIYNPDEGYVIKKIMSIFSLRPTIVAISPVVGFNQLNQPYDEMQQMPGVGLIANNQYQPPFMSNSYTTTSKIAVFDLNLPPYHPSQAVPEKVSLNSAFNQYIWINENKNIVPKQRQIIFTNEVLIFHVNRRIQRMQYKSNGFIDFNSIPLSLTNTEMINKYPVDVTESIILPQNPSEIYQLRSVVALTEMIVKKIDTPMITGSTALLTVPIDPANAKYEADYYLYDPVGASYPYPNRKDGTNYGDKYTEFFTNKPISRITGYFDDLDQEEHRQIGFYNRACSCGTILIYVNPKGYSRNTIIRCI